MHNDMYMYVGKRESFVCIITHTCACTVHVNERCRRKEEEASKVKQTTKQSNTTHPRQSLQSIFEEKGSHHMYNVQVYLSCTLCLVSVQCSSTYIHQTLPAMQTGQV